MLRKNNKTFTSCIKDVAMAIGPAGQSHYSWKYTLTIYAQDIQDKKYKNIRSRYKN